MGLPPFLLEPVLKPKTWGGRKLEENLGRSLPEGEKIGESWELCAREDDSNIIGSGPLEGKSLLEAISNNPEELLGRKIVEKYGMRLPLLVKFIDASEWLSVQVHPDDCSAAELRQEDSGKHEAWVVIEARPGASLVLGASRELSFEEIVELCEKGMHNECLNYVEVEKGDVIAVPPGTLHAIGSGILLLEVSQNSDLTYRVNDWNRKIPGRDLHRKEAKGVAICAPPVSAVRKINSDSPLKILYDSEYFRILEAKPEDREIVLEGGMFRAITILEGEMKIQGKIQGVESQISAKNGRTVLIPGCVGEFYLQGRGQAIIAEPV